jgi:hypothetical protein
MDLKRPTPQGWPEGVSRDYALGFLRGAGDHLAHTYDQMRGQHRKNEYICHAMMDVLSGPWGLACERREALTSMMQWVESMLGEVGVYHDWFMQTNLITYEHNPDYADDSRYEVWEVKDFLSLVQEQRHLWLQDLIAYAETKELP